MTLWRIIARLNDRGETVDQSTIRVLAPLEFRTIGRKQSPWKSYFSPSFNGGEGQDERPCLAHLTAEDVDAWAHLTEVIKNAPVRARFADAVWELGKTLGSSRTDLHLYGQRAAELYLEAADADVTSQSFLPLLEIMTRAISLGMQFRRVDLIERGIRRMLEFADAADQAHLGLWLSPFERLIGLKGLSDCHRDEILDRHERRLTASIANRELHQVMMAGGLLAKYFHDHKNYTRAKEIALLCGEAVLEIAASMTAALATHHIGDVLHWYRQVGLREDAERVHVLLEKRAKDVFSEMKRQRIEVPVDRKGIEEAITGCLSVPDPLWALYRLAVLCLPNPQKLKEQLDKGGFIAHRIMPTEIIGNHGLPVGSVSTDEEDDGNVVIQMVGQMNFSAAVVFLSGIDEWKKKFELGRLPDTPNILDSPLIPADRTSLYGEGLAAFDAKDFVKCIHVLVPQIENSLRELLTILGGSSTKMNEEGAFELKNINDVLHDSRLRDSLDERLWSFLKVLYADKRGMNLRNYVAHGIAPVEAFNPVNASLVIQSVALLTMIRPEALFIPNDEEGEPDHGS